MDNEETPPIPYVSLRDDVAQMIALCQLCGCLIWDHSEGRARHDRWHAELNRSIQAWRP